MGSVFDPQVPCTLSCIQLQDALEWAVVNDRGPILSLPASSFTDLATTSTAQLYFVLFEASFNDGVAFLAGVYLDQ